MKTYKFSMKSVNLCKITARCPDVLVDQPHLLTNILIKKVELISAGVYSKSG